MEMINEALLNTEIGKKTNLKLTDKQKIIAAYHESTRMISPLNDVLMLLFRWPRARVNIYSWRSTY